MGKKNSTGIFFLAIFVIAIIVGIILGIYFGVKNKKKNKGDENNNNNKFVLTESHKSRVSLLQQCMNISGAENIPELKDEEFNSTMVSENKLLSITKIEINGKKGETVELFKDTESVEVETGEYTCISFKYNNNTEHIERIINGMFTIPYDLDTEVNETEFTFILYFNYEPEIIEEEYKKILMEQNSSNTSLVLYDEKVGNQKLLKRRLSIFSKIFNFFKKNIKEIVEKVVEKVVSTVCVAVIKYLCQDYSNVIVKSVGKFACDEIGEFVGEGVTELIFNSDSKPAENYKEIVYEEMTYYNFSQLSSSEAEILRKTFKGGDKNNQELIKFIVNRTNSDRLKIKRSYHSVYGSDLIEDLKGELSGDFENAVLPLFYHPYDYDCMELKLAMAGSGTDEDTLIEIITNRNNSAIRQIKQRYPIINPGSNLISNVIDDTSGNFKNTLVALLEEKRAENNEVNYEECQKSARLLWENKKDSVYLQIFTEKSKVDFVSIEDYYYELTGKTLLDTVKKEFSGDFEDGLVGIYYAMINPAQYFAQKIHDSIYGIGTDDHTLIRVIVSRYEEDLPLIKEVYEEMFDADMIEDIIDDTSGDYMTLLVSLVKGEYSKASFLKVYIKLMLTFLFIFIIF